MNAMNPKNHFIFIIRTGITVFVLIILMVFQSNANTQPAPIFCENDMMICNAEDLLLSDFEDLLYQECGIRIAGLKSQEGQRITYKTKGPILESIKRLLRYLDAESYVFEFNGERLAHVLIYSRGKSRHYRPGINRGYSQSKQPGKTVNAVKVLDIVPGSQAEVHGFQKDDIIVEYDTVPIKSASQLVSVVKKKKKEKQRVELVLVRNGSRQSYILNSGLIGVRIQTIRVPPEDIR